MDSSNRTGLEYGKKNYIDKKKKTQFLNQYQRNTRSEAKMKIQ